MKRTRSIRKSIYQLKRAYGFRVTLCRAVSTDFNFETGAEQNVTQFKVIKRAILLPAELRTSDKIEYQYETREILLDWNDIKIIGVELNDFILFSNQTWQVSKVEDYELDTIKLIEVRHISGSVYTDPLNPDVQVLLGINQGVEDA